MITLTGKVIATPTKVTGVGQRGPWARTTVVIEVEDQYPYKLAMDNSRMAEEFAKLLPGSRIKVNAHVSSREYNGKWYTGCECFSWEVLGAQAEAEAAPADSAPAAEEAKEEDLPF